MQRYSSPIKKQQIQRNCVQLLNFSVELLIFKLAKQQVYKFFCMHVKWKCRGSNKAAYVCTTRKCNDCAFTCKDTDCCSNILHEDCNIISVEEFSQAMRSSQQHYEGYISRLMSSYDMLTKKIQYDRYELQLWVDGHNERFKKLQDNQKDQYIMLTGDSMSKLSNILTISSEQYCYNIISQLEQLQQSVNRQIDQIKKIYTKTRKRIQEQRNSTYVSCQLDSLIVLNENDIKSLSKIINSDNRIRQIKLLFRATQQEFSAQKFHEICDGIPNTLVLVKNSKGKINGGFTPLPWQRDSIGIYLRDSQQISYVFNLNNEEKFPLFEPDYAIECNSCCGPFFGRGAILWIYDQADKTVAYWHVLPTSYHPIGAEWTNETYEEFIGAKMYQKFTIRQWEVFQIIFEL